MMNLLFEKFLFALVIDSSFLAGTFLTLIAPEELHPGRKIINKLMVVFLLSEIVIALNIRRWNIIWRFLTYLTFIILIYAKRLDIRKKSTYYIAIIFFAMMTLLIFSNDTPELKVLLTGINVLTMILFEINLTYVRFEKYFKRKKKNLSRKIEHKIRDKAIADFLIILLLTIILLIII